MQAEVIWQDKTPHYFDIDDQIDFELLLLLCKTGFDISTSRAVQLFYLSFGDRRAIQTEADWKACFAEHMFLIEGQESIPNLVLEIEYFELNQTNQEDQVEELLLNQPEQSIIQPPIFDPSVFDWSSDEEKQKTDQNSSKLMEPAQPASLKREHAKTPPPPDQKQPSKSNLNPLNPPAELAKPHLNPRNSPVEINNNNGLQRLSGFFSQPAKAPLLKQMEDMEEKPAVTPQSKYPIAANSPAQSPAQGPPQSKSIDEFFSELRRLNPDSEQRALIDTIEPYARDLYRCLHSSGSPSSALVQDVLKVAKAAESSEGGVKKTPRINQIFAVLAGLLKPPERGLLVQIATGEGKSLIGRVLAASVVLHKKGKTDLLSSAGNLVEREVQESEEFYRSLGYSVGSCIGFHEKYKSAADRNANNVYIKNEVLCGTVHDFSANQLRDFLNNLRYTPTEDDKTKYALFAGKRYSDCRPGAFLILDEVDNMFIDEQNCSTRIVSTRTTLEALDAMLYDVASGIQRMFTAEPPSIDEAVIKLDEAFKDSSYFATMNLTKEEQEIWDLNKQQIFQSAYRAHFCLHQDRDYIIEKEQVQIVDKNNTGEVRKNSRWSNYLHEFIELKHNLPSKRSTEAALVKSTVAFFDDYGPNLFGMTGTLGDRSTIQFLKDTYKVITIDIPRSNKNRKILYEPIIEKTALMKSHRRPAVSDELRDFICHQIDAGRPCLIVSSTIEQASHLAEQLPGIVNDYTGIRINKILYTRQDVDNLHEVVQKVKPKDVIFATALAGRGTDIKLDDQAKKNGGLSVVINYLPTSIRSQQQIEGRSGRNGENGSSIMIFSDTRHSQFETAEFCIAVRNSLEESQMADAAKKVEQMRQDEVEYTKLKDCVSEYQETDPIFSQAILDNYSQLNKKNELIQEADSGKKEELIKTMDDFLKEMKENKDSDNKFLSSQSRSKNFLMAISPKAEDCEKLKAKLPSAKQQCTAWQKKELQLVEATVEFNLGKTEKAEKLVNELEVHEIQEAGLIRSKAHFEALAKGKFIVNQIAFEVKQINNPCLQQAAQHLEKNFSIQNCTKFAAEIKELAQSHPNLNSLLGNFSKIQLIQQKAETNLNKLLEAHFSEYGSLKNKLKKAIQHNKSCEKEEEKYCLQMKENCHDIQEIEVALKPSEKTEEKKTGWLGYILGGAMIIGGIAAICCFTLPALGTAIAMGFVEKGFDSIQENYQMNELGTYDQRKVFMTALSGSFEAIVKPTIKHILMPGCFEIFTGKGTIPEKLKSFLALSYANPDQETSMVTLAISCLTNLGRMLSTEQMKVMEKETEMLYNISSVKAFENHNKALEAEKLARERKIVMDNKVKEVSKGFEQDLNRFSGLTPCGALIMAGLFDSEKNQRAVYNLFLKTAQEIIEEVKEEITPEAMARVEKVADLKSFNWTSAKSSGLSRIRHKITLLWRKDEFTIRHTKLLVSVAQSAKTDLETNCTAQLKNRSEELFKRLQSQADNFDPNLNNDIESYKNGNPKRFTHDSLQTRLTAKSNFIDQINNTNKKEQDAVQKEVESEAQSKVRAIQELFNSKDSLNWLEETVDKLLEARESGRQVASAQLLKTNVPGKYRCIRDELCSALDKEIMNDQLLTEIRKVKDFFAQNIWNQGFDEALEALIRLDIVRQASNRY